MHRTSETAQSKIPEKVRRQPRFLRRIIHFKVLAVFPDALRRGVHRQGTVIASEASVTPQVTCRLSENQRTISVANSAALAVSNMLAEVVN